MNRHMIDRACVRLRAWIPAVCLPVLGASLLFAASDPSKVPPGDAPVPPVGDLRVKNLYQAIRASLGCGSEFLIGKMSTNDPFYVPLPASYVDHYSGDEQVDVRYSRKMIDVPVYEDVWEDYEIYVMQPGASAIDPPRRVKTTQHRLVNRILKSTRKEEQLVYDPQGPIIVKVTRLKSSF